MSREIFTDEAAWEEEWRRRQNHTLQKCSRCIYSERTPRIIFDAKGVCNYCHTHDQLMEQYQINLGEKELEKIIHRIKQEGKNKKYDVIVGVSGGADSSYMLYLAKEYGLRPLAAHYDNTWNSKIAVENIQKLLSALHVDLSTYIVDNEEYDDLYRAILRAGVPDLEIPTDLALAVTLNVAAIQQGIQYIFEGHSFMTEGIAPLGWPYMDAKYLFNIHRSYGELKNLSTYPYMWLSKQLKWMLWNRLKKIRPFWYINYHKEQAKKILKDKFDWEWYGGHHLENRMTNFYQTYFIARRFNRDSRVNGFAAMVRSGQMDRADALETIMTAPKCDLQLIELVKKRLKLNEEDFIQLMTQEKRTYKDFKTYKPTFEKMRPFFYLMAKLNLIPMSFYLKYTKKDNWIASS